MAFDRQNNKFVNSRYAACVDVDDSVVVSQQASMNRKRLRVKVRRSRSMRSGVRMMLAMPVSSSRERKTKPLAVLRRCLKMTRQVVLALSGNAKLSYASLDNLGE